MTASGVAQIQQQLIEQVRQVQRYVDRCMLYGPTDALRDHLHLAGRCADELEAALLAVDAPQQPPAQPRLTVDEAERIIHWLVRVRDECSLTDGDTDDLGRLIERVHPRPAIDIYNAAWPDGSVYREKWLLHVWYHVPSEILSQACIRAKEDTGPHYLMFMEPDGYHPKADFTCWICGKPTPHHHAQCEIDAARKTLEVFHEHVWSHLCEAQSIARKPVDAPPPQAEEPSK